MKERTLSTQSAGVRAAVLQVAVLEGYEPEDQAEGQPGGGVGQREDHEHVAPLGVHGVVKISAT